jgi:hypothetical protein
MYQYSKPKILLTEDAVLAVEHVGSSEPDKPLDMYIECYNPPNATTIGAYEADE